MTGANEWVEMLKTTDPKGINLRVVYSTAAGDYKVEVSYGEDTLTERFKALYEPRFGMDVDDQAQAYEIAERLAVQIEEKLGL